MARAGERRPARRRSAGRRAGHHAGCGAGGVGAAAEHGLSKAKTAELARAASLPDEVVTALAHDATDQSVEQVAAAVRQACLEHAVPEPAVEPSCELVRSADHARLTATVGLVEAEVLEVALDAYAEAAKLAKDQPYAKRRASALVGLARHYLDHAVRRACHAGRPATCARRRRRRGARGPVGRLGQAGFGWRSSPATKPGGWRWMPTSVASSPAAGRRCSMWGAPPGRFPRISRRPSSPETGTAPARAALRRRGLARSITSSRGCDTGPHRSTTSRSDVGSTTTRSIDLGRAPWPRDRW